jgi:hypothetical protein
MIRKVSPIDSSPVKENTSPCEETIIGDLLRCSGVAYSLGRSLFFVFAGMLLRWCPWI